MADNIYGTAKEEISRVSWGSVIAGVVTVLAVSMLLSLLGTAIGSGVVDPQSNNPFDGFGTTFGIASALFLIISFAAGGFVSGRLANSDGFIHGFLSWATAALLSLILLVITVGHIASAGVSALGTVVSGAGQVAGSAAQGLGNAAQSLGEQLSDTFDVEDDPDSPLQAQDFRYRINQILRDTDAAALQPEYLRNQAQQAVNDIETAFRRLTNNPNQYDAILDDLLENLRARIENIEQDVDRDALVNALVNNTDMTEEEAENFIDESIARLDDGIDRLEQQVDAMEERLEQARVELDQLEQSLRESAEEATQTIQQSALMAFIAMLIASLISGFAGLIGSRTQPKPIKRTL